MNQAESSSSLYRKFCRRHRERVVIIRATNDVSFVHTLRAMTQLPVSLTNKKAGGGGGKRSPPLANRFTDQVVLERICFYEISDQALYEARLEAFCTFYGRFYNGSGRTV